MESSEQEREECCLAESKIQEGGWPPLRNGLLEIHIVRPLVIYDRL